jgi:hypothetical protein
MAVRDGKNRLERRRCTFRRHRVDRLSRMIIGKRSFRKQGAASLGLA